jgi:hypothetical protein
MISGDETRRCCWQVASQPRSNAAASAESRADLFARDASFVAKNVREPSRGGKMVKLDAASGPAPARLQPVASTQQLQAIVVLDHPRADEPS